MGEPIDNDLHEDLEAVAGALEEASFRLPFDDRAARDAARAEMASGIRQFLLPRLTEPDAPVAGLLTGLTGVGKSTLLNSLAGRRLAPVSAIRPTTIDPVVWAHRRNAGRYWQEFVAKVEEHIGPSAEIVIDDEPLLEHLTLIDAPPLGAGAGAELFSLADLCLFVTSATRYADSDTWDLLEQVRGRGVPVLFIMNKVPRDAGSSQAVTEDFAAKLAEAGFIPKPDASLLFLVYEHRVDISTDGLPPASVAALRQELSELADPAFREKLTETATRSLLADLSNRLKVMAGTARGEAAKGRDLLAMAERSYNARIAAIGTDLEHGKFNELAEHWDPDRLARSLTRHVGIGAQESAAAWSTDPVGRRLTEGPGEALWRGADGAADLVGAAIGEWGSHLEALAVERSRRRRLLPGTRKGLAKLLRSSALAGAGGPIHPKLAKRYGEQGVVAVIRAARSSLLDVLGTAFQADASRYRAAVGPIEQLEITAGLLDEKAVVFQDAAR